MFHSGNEFFQVVGSHELLREYGRQFREECEPVAISTRLMRETKSSSYEVDF